MSYTITFAKLPETLDELKALPEADMKSPEKTAALTVAALAAYPKNKEECYKMLDYLRGPRPLSPMEKQFIRDRFMDGKDYIPLSYFKGATPDNGYVPNVPYVIEFFDSATQFAEENYTKLNVQSSGADSMRSVTLRLKPSTGEYFLWEQMLLAGIRIPVSQDPWA